MEGDTLGDTEGVAVVGGTLGDVLGDELGGTEGEVLGDVVGGELGPTEGQKEKRLALLLERNVGWWMAGRWWGLLMEHLVYTATWRV